MDLFKNIIQPTIVHLSDNDNLAISNRYFLNYNVVQIDWFANNSIVMEDGSGIIVLESADMNNPLSSVSHDVMDLMDDKEINNSVLDIPRIYFVINDNFLDVDGSYKTPKAITSFITTLLSLSDNCIEHYSLDNTSFITDFILNGETFNGVTLTPGKDFFINETFANYLISIDLGVEDPYKIRRINNITLPNYLDKEANIQAPWVQLTETEENNTDLSVYYMMNELVDFSSEYDIKNLCSSFCAIILDKSTFEVTVNDYKNLNYQYVLEYFKNNQTDRVSIGLELALGTQYTAQSINTASKLCNSNTTSGMTSCVNIYKDAMFEHLKEMLGNVNFYKDWFFNTEIIDNKEVCKPNDELIKNLRMLLKSFKDEYSDSMNTSYNCKCNAYLYNQNMANNDIKGIITKYENVLDYVKSCSLQYNINKIKVYGNKFGEVLPQLNS